MKKRIIRYKEKFIKYMKRVKDEHLIKQYFAFEF